MVYPHQTGEAPCRHSVFSKPMFMIHCYLVSVGIRRPSSHSSPRSSTTVLRRALGKVWCHQWQPPSPRYLCCGYQQYNGAVLYQVLPNL